MSQSNIYSPLDDLARQEMEDYLDSLVRENLTPLEPPDYILAREDSEASQAIEEGELLDD